ncbi:MAG: hypothetical protein M1837_003784 [Sclerophora amabilis]|nr:MAG: hypothetical protein M1837_003784 [Sclerophora amabilis]
MGRRKIEIKAIKDDRNRSVTFLKRKGGLFKKAHELSVLCSVDVAVIIFGHNKKLYEFSSGDINEVLGRYSYYGNAHEHKGPADFSGKKDLDDDDDEEMGSPAAESHSSQEHHMIPPQLQSQVAYQHMRQHTPSASPPMPNVPYNQRRTTPQPQGISRPSSRTNVRRTSSNLAPQHLPHVSQHPPTQNGYAYRPNPPIYNPQAGAGMPMQPGPGQPPPYHQYPPQPHPPPPHHHQTQQVFIQEQRRQSMPPAFPQERPQGTPEQQPPPPPPPQQQQQQQQHQHQHQHQHPQHPQPSPPQPQHPTEQQSLAEPKRLSAKSKSIFTPVDESRSLLAQHWGMGTTSGEQQTAKGEPPIKSEGGNRSQSVDLARVGLNGPTAPPRMTGPPATPQQKVSMPPVEDIPPPSRSASVQLAAQQGGKRPRLKVQIPSEQSDGGSATADSSPRGSAGASGGRSAKANTEGSHSSGVVLPPPSPSASAILSAGAQGPPNPFARPNPPGSTAPSNNNIDTPMSALPSRFMAEGLLPSPSSFYPGWDFGRSGGGDSNVLPSPLNFQTPVAGSGPSFLREDSDGMKRKSPEGGESSDGGGGAGGGGTSKRVKT